MQSINHEVIYKVENAHWNKTIASRWNIQRMSFKVVGPRYYNNFFARVQHSWNIMKQYIKGTFFFLVMK